MDGWVEEVEEAKSYPIFTTTAGDERKSQSWVNHKGLLESHNLNRLLMWRKYMRVMNIYLNLYFI